MPKISREIGDRRGEGNNLGNLGSTFSELGEFIKAIELLESALAIGKSVEDQRIIRFCNQQLRKTGFSGIDFLQGDDDS